MIGIHLNGPSREPRVAQLISNPISQLATQGSVSEYAVLFPLELYVLIFSLHLSIGAVRYVDPVKPRAPTGDSLMLSPGGAHAKENLFCLLSL